MHHDHPKSRFILLIPLAGWCGCATLETERQVAAGGQSATGGGPASGSAGQTVVSGSAASGGSTAASGGTSTLLALGGWPSTVPTTPPRPPSLTLPYVQDFEQGTTTDWIRLDNGTVNLTANWPIVEDPSDSANHVFGIGPSSDDTWEVGGDYRWKDQTLTVKLKFAATDAIAYVAVRFTGADDYYYLQVPSDGKPKIRARTTTNGSSSTTDVCSGTTNFTAAVGTWYTVTVSAIGSTVSASIDGVAVCSGSSSALPAGGIAVGSDGAQVYFDDVNVT